MSFLYGILSYGLFLLAAVYAVGFLGNFGVPKSLDAPRTGPLAQAILVNSLLLGVFAIQHSVMARPWFKRWFTKFVPASIERSTYVLLSSLLVGLIFWQWQPMGGVLWDLQNPVARSMVYGLYAFGWVFFLISTFVINHFDLFGLRQVWAKLRGKSYIPLGFSARGPYRYMRHPLYLGWMFIFWATPTMTLAHLLFAGLCTAYILVAVRFEEHDLAKAHPEYTAYKRSLPMMVPTGRRFTVETPAEASSIVTEGAA